MVRWGHGLNLDWEVVGTWTFYHPWRTRMDPRHGETHYNRSHQLSYQFPVEPTLVGELILRGIREGA